SDLVDRPLEARLRLVVPVADAMEHAHHRLGGLEDLLGGEELLERQRRAAQRRQTPARGELEADPPVLTPLDEAEIVDARQRAVGAAASAERRLELARQRRRVGPAQ